VTSECSQGLTLTNLSS